MATVILLGAVLVAVLVMLSGVWVATVLIGSITRVQQPTPSAGHRAIEKTGP